MEEHASLDTILTHDDDKDDLAARIVALVGSRLCHDLISPLGAIGNGVELLQMTGSWPGLDQSPEMVLINDSLRSARARITCFRMAFGAAGDTQRVPPAELADLIRDMERAGRLQITLDAEGDQARRTVKLLLLSLMCLETAIPWGGRVGIVQNGRHWELTATAERTRQDPALWSWLNGLRPGLVNPAAAEVHFPLLSLTASEMKRRLHWSLDETTVRIFF
ncbi:MAG: histidine phosphotransferase family protein [Paracoccus sp. (in: a-proteobacteria)]